MSQFSAAMLMSLIAGGATAIGSLMVMFGNKTNTRFLSFALGFSAGIMVYISIACLIPESVEYLSYELDAVKAGLLSIVFMLIGIAISAVIDTFVPEFENPHSLKKVEDAHDKNVNNLYRVGVMSAVAIAIHNFPEGIATFMTGYGDISKGMSIAFAVALHNIPEGIAVSVPLYYATGSRKKAFVLSALSGLTEPLGALLAYLVLAPFMSDYLMGAIYSAIAGIMLYISFDELLPASRQYGHEHSSVFGVMAGIAVIAVGLLFTH